MEYRPAVEISVNGEPRQITADSTVSDLVTMLDLTPQRLAIELNLAIVPRQNWAATKLKSGDRLEVVHFVGGG